MTAYESCLASAAAAKPVQIPRCQARRLRDHVANVRHTGQAEAGVRCVPQVGILPVIFLVQLVKLHVPGQLPGSRTAYPTYL